MLSWGMPLRRKDVSTPCGLSWMNCSICGDRGLDVGIGALLREGWRSAPGGRQGIRGMEGRRPAQAEPRDVRREHVVPRRNHAPLDPLDQIVERSLAYR